MYDCWFVVISTVETWQGSSVVTFLGFYLFRSKTVRRMVLCQCLQLTEGFHLLRHT